MVDQAIREGQAPRKICTERVCAQIQISKSKTVFLTG